MNLNKFRIFPRCRTIISFDKEIQNNKSCIKKSAAFVLFSSGSGLAAIRHVPAAGYIDDGMYFTHTDYQGNLLALTSEKTGIVVERYAGVYPDE